MNLKQVKFSDYYRQVFPKTQVYLHHTAGTGQGQDVYRWWGSDKPRVATCVIIDRDGTIKQGFSSKYWAYHLGLKNKHFKAEGLTYSIEDLNIITHIRKPKYKAFRTY